MQRVESKGIVIRKRRAFSHEEIARLIAAAPERRPVYLMAVHTGLRRGELSSLQWSDLHLDAPKPFVSVRAQMTKNSKQAVIALHPDIVIELCRLQAVAHQPTDFIFADLMPKMDTFKDDLKRAGIDYQNAQGQYADFHALRYTLATNLARAGVAPRVAMEVMRHSDMHLTTRTYTDVGLLPTADVVDMLPSFTKPHPSQLDSQKPFSDSPQPSSVDTKKWESADSQVPAGSVIRRLQAQSDTPSQQTDPNSLFRARKLTQFQSRLNRAPRTLQLVSIPPAK